MGKRIISYSQKEQEAILKWLKVEHTIEGSNARAEYIEVVQEGLPTYSVNEFVKLSKLTKKQVAKLIHLSDRTLQRNPPTKKLSTGPSERLLELARLFYKGYEVFGSNEKFIQWLNRKSMALGGQRPMDLIGTGLGTEMVMDELMRIESGVFA
jgi:putative toxin-antitoxin system antitoxin component (TIGR02293 family)